jgi:hypothetical protein
MVSTEHQDFRPDFFCYEPANRCGVAQRFDCIGVQIGRLEEWRSPIFDLALNFFQTCPSVELTRLRFHRQGGELVPH